MKKLFLIITLSLISLSATAQERQPFTRQTGDIGVTIDASPVLQYVGNMFNNTTNNFAPAFSTGNIKGSYFLSPTQSIGVTLGFDFANATQNNNLILGANYGLHIGSGRLQAAYGAGVAISFNSGNVDVEDSTYGFGFNGFFGIEYFLTGNISLGGQFGVGLMYDNNNADDNLTFSTMGSGFYVSFYF